MKQKKQSRDVLGVNSASPPPSASQAAPPETPVSKNKGKRWGFRLAALSLPIILAVVAEIVLRILGFGDSSRFFLKRQIDQKEVYIENQRFSRRFFPPALVRHPQSCLFEVQKKTNACRIFVFGESAAMGDPEPAFGFSRVLEVLLKERYPKIDFEVINTSITAINSHVILPATRDCVDKQGDFWVVYMGNNEVVGPYGAGTVFGSQTPSLSLIRLGLALKTTRIGQAFTRAANHWSESSKTPKSWGGMEIVLCNSRFAKTIHA